VQRAIVSTIEVLRSGCHGQYRIERESAMRLFAGTKFDIPPRCDRCGALEEECQCPPPKLAPESQTVRLVVEKRKKGKVVTAVHGLSAEGNDLPELLSRLKRVCGTGGTIKNDVIELQGDHVKRAIEILAEIGCRIRK
jgi:translation initiation factor 1